MSAAGHATSASTHAGVLVVGAGAAGIAAARSARESHASRVVLVADGPGASALTAGYLWGAHEPPPWLAPLGFATGALEYVDFTGVVHRAKAGLDSLLALSPRAPLREGPLAVVDLLAGPAWSATHVARSLREHGAGEVVVVRPDPFDAAPRGDAFAPVARALDTEGLVDALAASLRAQLHATGCASVLFPPVLGLARDDVAARLSRLLDVAVGECAGGVGDPPSVRLARRLARAIPDGIERVTGRAQLELARDGVRPLVRVGARVFEPDAVILATGALAGGGLEFGRTLRETVANAPVFLAQTDTHGRALAVEPTADRGLDPQRFFSSPQGEPALAAGAGVRVDARGRVVGLDGRAPLHDWLFAAGALVSGPHGFAGPGLCDVLAAGAQVGAHAAALAQR